MELGDDRSVLKNGRSSKEEAELSLSLWNRKITPHGQELDHIFVVTPERRDIYTDSNKIIWSPPQSLISDFITQITPH